MPIYDYYCKTCKHEQENTIPLSEIDSAKPECERCGSDDMIRCVGTPAFKIHGYAAVNGYATRNRFGLGESQAGEPIV